MKFREDVESLSVVFSKDTMNVVKVGETDQMKNYLNIMNNQLRNPIEVDKAVQAQMNALGVSRLEALQVIKTMQQEFHCIEVPNDKTIVESLIQTTGMRKYLQDNGMLFVADNEEDLKKQLENRKN